MLPLSDLEYILDTEHELSGYGRDLPDEQRRIAYGRLFKEVTFGSKRGRLIDLIWHRVKIDRVKPRLLPETGAANGAASGCWNARP